MSVFIRSATLGATSQFLGSVGRKFFPVQIESPRDRIRRSLSPESLNKFLREPGTMCSEFFHLVGQLRSFPLIDSRFHHLNILVGDIPKDGDSGLIFKLPFGLHDIHNHGSGLIMHTLGDQFVCQVQKGSDVALLRAARIGGQLFVKFETFTPKDPLKLKILENIVALLLGHTQIQLVGYEEKRLSLPNHLGTGFLIPSQVVRYLRTLVGKMTDLPRDRNNYYAEPVGPSMARG